MKDQLILTDEKFDIKKVKFDFCPNSSIHKPYKALWTSTAFKEEGSVTSDWMQWCIDEGYGFPQDQKKTILVPKKDVKVFEVNKDTYDKIPLRPLFKETIDWLWLKSEGYDGFHLPARAPFGWFNAWDCESTVWFNTDWIADIKEVN